MTSKNRSGPVRALASCAAVLALAAGVFGVVAAAGDQSNPAASRSPKSADGGPIRGFGNNGRVQTAFPVKAYTRPGAPRGAVAEGIARYGKHRLILAGFASNGEDNDIAVVRYLANGKLDPSFGLNGKLVTDLGDNEEGTDVAVDRQGRIVVVGFANSYSLNLGDVLVARYLADGTPDDSFGMNGIASPGRGGALAVAIDSHDRVLISGGGKNDDGSYGWFVERLTPAGDPDPDFGTGGRVEGIVAETSHAVDVAIDSQDRVAFAVCGDNEKDLTDVFAAVRLLEDGTPDPTFGDGGTAKLDFGSHACPRGIAVDHRGRIVLGGARGRFVGGRESGKILVARLSVDGTLDPSFSGNGTASIAVRNSRPFLGRIVVDGRNRVVLAGSIIPSGSRPARFPGRFLIAGLTAAGRVDRRIDGDGQVAFRFGPDKKFNAWATSLVLRGSAIYAAGYVRRGPASSIRFAAVGYRP